jgi:hypothetical protein
MAAPAPPRPWWMTALAVVCFLVLAISVVRDLFFPDSRGVEVWFGFEVHGLLALVTAPIHWAIFAIGAWAFWSGRRWIVPWAVGYVVYAAVAHLIWSEASPNGRGWPIGLLQAIAIAGFALLLHRTAAKDARTA